MELNNKKTIFLAILLLIAFLIILFLPFKDIYFSQVLAYRFDYDQTYFEDENIKIYILPSEEHVSKILEQINSANNEIHCALRSLNHNELEKILIEKEKTINVRLFINSDYLGNPNIRRPFVRFDDQNREGMMHSNYCVIDRETVITGSLIFNQNTLNQNLHDVLIVNSRPLANQFNSNFWKLYNKEEIQIKNDELEFIKINNDISIAAIFCPENDCETIVSDLIEKSEKEILFATYSFTNEKIISQIKNSQSSYFGIVEYYGLTNRSIYFENLSNIRLSRIVEILHTKLFVIDNDLVITGTMNPTYFGVNLNNESVLIIKSENINNFYKNFLNYLIKKSK